MRLPLQRWNWNVDGWLTSIAKNWLSLKCIQGRNLHYVVLADISSSIFFKGTLYLLYLHQALNLDAVDETRSKSQWCQSTFYISLTNTSSNKSKTSIEACRAERLNEIHVFLARRYRLYVSKQYSVSASRRTRNEPYVVRTTWRLII